MKSANVYIYYLIIIFIRNLEGTQFKILLNLVSAAGYFITAAIIF